MSGSSALPASAAPEFAVRGADLMVGELTVREIVARYGTPVFIYDASVMRRCYRALSQALRGFADIHYSVKANPAPAVIRLFLQEGAGLEIASVGEYRAALSAGAAPCRILFAGPGKRVSELEEVIAHGIGEIHLETGEEIARVAAIGRKHGRSIKAAIRVNPDATSQAGAMRMGGKPTAFGFDEEDLEHAIRTVQACGDIDLVGVHVYGGTQILDAAALVAQWEHAIGIASRVAARLSAPLQTIDLGGGLGIPYHRGDKTLNLERIASEIPRLSALLASDPLIARARVIVEPGRFLAGPAGIYVAEVNAVKRSRGARFVITDGGMHHHLAASGNLGQIIKRDYPVVAPARMDDDARHAAAVVGPLCTPLDTLARDARLPELSAGDLVAILQSGAYGATASPGRFLSHPAAAEVLVDGAEIARL